jgi:hypothetical protein
VNIIDQNKKHPLKFILQHNANWWHFFREHDTRIRHAIILNIVRWLSCGTLIRGHTEYRCSNPKCDHTIKVPFSCKGRACSSCGKKAAEIWMNQQNHILPKTKWQHITFTMPSQLWDFFWYNRFLLNKIPPLAANAVKTLAANKGVVPGIFLVIHTFGRDLKGNVHVHLSVTLWGISPDGSKWVKLYFKQDSLMKLWRYSIITLFRKSYMKKQLTLPKALTSSIRSAKDFYAFLDQLYKKPWIVHCSKPTNNHKKNVQYFVRYVKRPPIAESKLFYYDGNTVMFKYLNHTTKTYRKFSCSVEEFIARFIKHIPDVGFRLIRYYGFLANRVRSKFLPLVYQHIGETPKNNISSPTWASLIRKNFNLDPLACILCGSHMIFSGLSFGKSQTNLLKYHKQIALMQPCR